MARFQRVAAALLATVMALSMQAAVAAPPAVPVEKTTIEIWWHEYGPFTAYVKELIEAYKKVRPNVTVNATVTSSADINQKMSVALATGTGPTSWTMTRPSTRCTTARACWSR
jgi:ABC-type glycerol-3-phosphate transport system substrate-binding protein